MFGTTCLLLCLCFTNLALVIFLSQITSLYLVRYQGCFVHVVLWFIFAGRMAMATSVDLLPLFLKTLFVSSEKTGPVLLHPQSRYVIQLLLFVRCHLFSVCQAFLWDITASFFAQNGHCFCLILYISNLDNKRLWPFSLWTDESLNETPAVQL